MGSKAGGDSHSHFNMSEALDEIQWKSPEWIQQFGLHTGNVLDYFTESPFFDRTSNNQVLRMQFQFQVIPPNVNPVKHFQNKLTEMVGIEFVIAFVREPDFWIIRKQRRLSPQQTVPQQDYYIIGANVYQAPKTYDILSLRLLASVLSIKKSVDLLNKMSVYSISGGHQYPTAKDNEDQDAGTSLLVSSQNTNANTSTNLNNTPSLVTPNTANAQSAASLPPPANEVSASAFDSLLNSVVTSGNDSIYLDDIPLYGKGSTVEQLGLKINTD